MLARLRKSIKEKDAGFTLVELLVVMIIIGILAAIAIPVFLNQRQKAVDTSIRSDLRSYAQDVETAYVDTQAYPTQATYANASGIAAITQRPSDVNVIEYRSTATGFCLRGSSTKASTAVTGTRTYFIYDSAAGGLRIGAPMATSTNC